mgnify:CR=1 FL=1
MVKVCAVDANQKRMILTMQEGTCLLPVKDQCVVSKMFARSVHDMMTYQKWAGEHPKEGEQTLSTVTGIDIDCGGEMGVINFPMPSKSACTGGQLSVSCILPTSYVNVTVPPDRLRMCW